MENSFGELLMYCILPRLSACSLFCFFLRREVQLFEEEFGCFKKIMGSVLINQGGADSYKISG